MIWQIAFGILFGLIMFCGLIFILILITGVIGNISEEIEEEKPKFPKNYKAARKIFQDDSPSKYEETQRLKRMAARDNPSHWR